MLKMKLTMDQYYEELHFPEEPMEEKPVYFVSLARCEYDKTRKVLKLSSEYFGMPPSFFVKSHITGKSVMFVPVKPGDPLFDEDGWDGEQCIYRPVGELKTVDYMVIYNEY